MNNILPENISFCFYKRGNCHKRNYHKRLPAAATAYELYLPCDDDNDMKWALYIFSFQDFFPSHAGIVLLYPRRFIVEWFSKSIFPFYYRQEQSFMFREGDRYSAFMWSVFAATATFLPMANSCSGGSGPISARECILPFTCACFTCDARYFLRRDQYAVYRKAHLQSLCIVLISSQSLVFTTLKTERLREVAVSVFILHQSQILTQVEVINFQQSGADISQP